MKQLLAKEPIGTIVLVHGAFEHSGRYKWLAEKWQQASYHVVYGDLPGQGETQGIPGHINRFEEYIDQIMSWVEQAKSLKEPVFLLGHSMGGLAVVRTMQERKPDIKAVILSSPALGILSGPPKFVDRVTKLLDVMTPKLRVSGNLDPSAVTRNKDIQEQDKNDSLILKKVSVRWYHEFQREINQAYKKIQAFPDKPTLVMQAGADKIVNGSEVKRWYELLTNTQKNYKEWENLYHEIFNEPEREQVFEHAKVFLNNLQ